MQQKETPKDDDNNIFEFLFNSSPNFPFSHTPIGQTADLFNNDKMPDTSTKQKSLSTEFNFQQNPQPQ